MKILSLLLVLHCFCVTAFAQKPASRIAVIPEPVSIVQHAGKLVLANSIRIETSASPELQLIAAKLQNRMVTATGYSVTLANRDKKAQIRFLLNDEPEKNLVNEGYQLNINSENCTIKANRPAGIFYGVQTLLQLLPKEIESKQKVPDIIWELPCVNITDYPRFGWRGLLFDVSRHFFTKAEVKEFIDNMVKYKYNLLHWHLTDDEGWRIEIRSLPKLTEVGAWNARRTGYFGNFTKPTDDEPRNYGGFYTQDDIRELVKYAGERYVNIMPEVDVPGHSLAAVASYPELSCTPGAEKYHVASGEKLLNWDNGIPTAIYDNTLCPANEKVYVFLDKVFSEIAQLFPFEYIHIGGDECPKNYWESSPAVQGLIKKEGLKDVHAVQNYFVKRVEKIVESKGKKMMGWDEILDDGLSKGSTIVNWRNMKPGAEASKFGHEMVSCPGENTYVDLMQGNRIVEPQVYNSLFLPESYAYDPVPEGADPKLIKGGQANLWTEQIYNMRHANYMLWPRCLAVAECLWSPKAQKNWNSFTGRVETTFGRMDLAEVKYSRAMFDPTFIARKGLDGEFLIELGSEVNGLDIYYSFDNSHPDNFYPKYATPLSIPKGASMLKAITYRDGKPIGRQLDMPIDELCKRAVIDKK